MAEVRKTMSYEHQTPAAYSAVAVQNIWNPVLVATARVRIRNIVFAIATLAEDLEVRVIRDGITVVCSQAGATAGTDYRVYIEDTAAAETLVAVSTAPSAFGGLLSFLLEGKNVAVAIRKTSANGANTLSCLVNYDVLR